MGHHWSKCLALIREEPGEKSHRRKKVGGGKALREAAAYTQFVLIEPRETDTEEQESDSNTERQMSQI